MAKCLNIKKDIGFFICFWFLGIGSARSQANLSKFHITGYSQGTTYQLTYYAEDSVITQKQTDSLLGCLDRSVSLYKPTSLICRFNHSEEGIMIDKPFRELIEKAVIVNRATSGLVDITVKPLVDAWGFGVEKSVATPDAEDIRNILLHVGQDKIWLEGDFLHKKTPSVQIDLNGIAQGYTVDLLGGFCESRNVFNYLAEIGGEVRVKGTKPNDEPFRIGIEAIDGNDINPGPLRRIITPGSGAVTTSGNYRNYLKVNGGQVAHIIDPKTGYPTHNEIISVTVWAQDGISADGFDNGFIAMGVNRTLQFLADRTDIGAYIIYRKPDGSIADITSPVFKTFIDF